MALTISQKITLFEILEVPYDSTVDEPVDEFHLTGITHQPNNVDQQLQTKIINRLAALVSAEEAKLITYIERWEAIGTRVASISGGVGGIQGVEYDPDTELMRIQSRVKVIIPVMKYHREITLKADQPGLMGFSCR